MKFYNIVVAVTVVFVCIHPTQAKWESCNEPVEPVIGGKINALALNGVGDIFAGTLDGVFMSCDTGRSWIRCNLGLPDDPTIFSVAINRAGYVFVGTHRYGLIYSRDNGMTWTQVSLVPGRSANVRSIIENPAGDILIASTVGVFLSADSGITWTPMANGLPDSSDVYCLAISGSTIYAGTVDYGMFVTTDNGANWTEINTDFPAGKMVLSLTASGDTVFAGVENSQNWGGAFLSTNKGANWNAVNTGIPDHAGILSLAVQGNKAFAGTDGRGIFITDNNGTSWHKSDSGIPANRSVVSFAVHGTFLFAGTSDGLFLSTDSGTSYRAIFALPDEANVQRLSVTGTTIFAGTSRKGVYQSINNCTSWFEVNFGMPTLQTQVFSLTVKGNTVFAGTGNGIYLSDINSVGWTPAISNIIESFAVSGSGDIFAGGYGGMYCSFNNGTDWTAINTGLPTNSSTRAVAVKDTIIFAGVYRSGVYRSMKYGADWEVASMGLPEKSMVNSITVKDNALFAGMQKHGVYRSMDLGSTWTEANTGLPADIAAYSLVTSGNTIFVGTQYHGVYLSKDNAENWTEVNSGLCMTYDSCSVKDLAVGDTLLFAATNKGLVFRRPLSEMIGVTPINPTKGISHVTDFSPHFTRRHGAIAIISFSIHRSQRVNITLYSPSGRTVSTLTNHRYPAGSHNLRWDTRTVTAGCYILHIEIGTQRHSEIVSICR